MTKRYDPPLYGKRFCGNTNKREVHDLDKETVQCKIDEIIAAGHARTFVPDALEQAHSEGYDNCYYCIENRKW